MIIVPPVGSSTPASPSALELGGKIVGLIREFQQSHPDLSPQDIRQAIRLAETSTAAGDRQRKALILMIGIGVLFAIVAFSLQGGRGLHRAASPMILMGIVVAIALGFAVFLSKRS